MEGYTWTQILLFFFFYCFLGWIFESVYVSIVERKLTNRGFLRGPMIPIYGFGAMMIVFATTPFRGNYIAEFLSGMIAATLFEYVVGVLMEAIFKVRYWDYSHKPFQYKGYICLESSLCWGVLSVIAAELLQSRLESVVFAVPQSMAVALAVGIGIVFCVDTVVSVRDAWGVRNIVIGLEKMKGDLEQLQQDLEDRSEEFVQFLEKRMKTKKLELEHLLDELEQRRSEQKEQLTQEIAQLRLEIEKEKKEREAAKMQLSARIERDINGLQERMEQEREELYDKLRQAKADYEERKLGQTARANSIFHTMNQSEDQLAALLQKPSHILRRNPNAVSRTLGNVQKYIEQEKQQRHSDE